MFKDTETGINRWFGQACIGMVELHSTTKFSASKTGHTGDQLQSVEHTSF